MKATDDDILVMAEWYDLFIPPRHHMAVVPVHQARAIARDCLVIACYYLCPRVLKHEQTEAKRLC